MKTFRIIKKLSQLGRIGYYYFNLTYVLKTRLFELKFLMKKKKRNFTLIQLNFIKIKTMQMILSFYNYDSYNKINNNMLKSYYEKFQVVIIFYSYILKYFSIKILNNFQTRFTSLCNYLLNDKH